ncbi:hypothetical protein KIN20_028178 [Parelaphostrongylus tenuis]|uniref:Uncharacterized protein n=1 Tax=Parelaphostrongylus tenuis TaxID=148309 RepID=A0AAD5WEH3_PARTN|nr:hypothetical protein KIN20_028178 [Parelaphostrongylus tenuis]
MLAQNQQASPPQRLPFRALRELENLRHRLMITQAERVIEKHQYAFINCKVIVHSVPYRLYAIHRCYTQSIELLKDVED